MSSLPMIVSGGGGGAVITITYTEDFYNQTITCSHGSKTYSKTATSSGSVEFNVGEEGQWVISCVIDGQPYTTTVDIDLSGEGALAKGKNGKTVLPTDDIDTWIKCAGLQNTNSYSTLAEVLADTELFDTLLRDSNACDYMARSTEWALAEGLVPAMTSNTEPNGVCSTNFDYSSRGAYQPYKGLNPDYNGGSNYWFAYTTGNYTRYEFETAKFCNRYRFGYVNLLSSAVTVKVQGSNDGSTWVDLSEVITLPVRSTTLGEGFIDGMTIEPDTYKYCQIIIVNAPSGGSGTAGIAISHIQYYSDADITTNAEAMTRVGKYDYCSDTLLNNEEWCEAIAESDYFEEILDVKVPTMTSATAPSGRVTASREDNWNNFTHYAWFAFNGYGGSEASSWGVHSSYFGDGQWIQYEATEAYVLKCFEFHNFFAQNPSKHSVLTIKGSNDGTSFDDLLVLQNSDIESADRLMFPVNNNTAYKFYRLLVTGNGLSSEAANNWSVLDYINFHGRHDSNKYIPLVPIMTDATHPSGEVRWSSQYASGREGWKAFSKGYDDGTNNTMWVGNPSNYSDEWIEYVFPTAIRVEKIILSLLVGKNDNACRNGSYKLQVSDDGTAYTDVQTISWLKANGVATVNVENSGSHRYWRIKTITSNWVNSTYPNGYSQFAYIQFYSIIPPTKQIHSCPNDTIYIMRNGSPVTVATTDLNGLGEVDWADLDAGEFTLYSTVAKDPANLSNDYSKVCRVTNTQYGHTTDFYLMPENSYYWYGFKPKEYDYKSPNIYDGEYGGHVNQGIFSDGTNCRQASISGSGTFRKYNSETIDEQITVHDGDSLKYIFKYDNNALQLGSYDFTTDITGYPGYAAMVQSYYSGTVEFDPLLPETQTTNTRIPSKMFYQQGVGTSHSFSLYAMFLIRS